MPDGCREGVARGVLTLAVPDGDDSRAPLRGLPDERTVVDQPAEQTRIAIGIVLPNLATPLTGTNGGVSSGLNNALR